MPEYANLDPCKTDPSDETFPVKGMPALHKKVGRDVNESIPSTIIEYFNTIEATMNGLVKSDQLKKFYAVGHLGDWATKDLWKSLPQYQNGTYLAFRRAVLSHYPEAADLVRGSRERLNNIFARHQNISVGDYGVVMRLALEIRRAAGLLIKKGADTSRALVTNLDLCRMIYGSLDSEFEASVKFTLNMKPRTPTEGALREDIDHDPFTWEEVLETAEELAKQFHSLSYAPLRRNNLYESDWEATSSEQLVQSQPHRELELEDHPVYQCSLQEESELAQIRDLLQLQHRQSQAFQAEVTKRLQQLERETAQLREISGEFTTMQLQEPYSPQTYGEDFEDGFDEQEFDQAIKSLGDHVASLAEQVSAMQEGTSWPVST